MAAIKKSQPNLGQEQYEREVSDWAGQLSETWERMIALEVVGQIFDFGTQEVRPRMFRLLAKLTDTDNSEFQSSYGRCSQWARRHDKSLAVNHVAPSVQDLEAELDVVKNWYDRVRKYKS